MADTLRYLCERQIGYSASMLAFPGLADCMALVLQNDGGMFGMHLIGGDEGAVSFAQWIQKHANFSDKWNRMYVACFVAKRHGTGTAGIHGLVTEVDRLAKALKFKGEVDCYDTAESGLGSNTTDSLYVQFQRTGPSSVLAHYKRTAKLNVVTRGGIPAHADHDEITGLDSQLSGKLAYATTSVTAKVSPVHSGKMHAFKLVRKIQLA